MLLKHRPPDIDSTPVALHQGFAHLGQESVAVLRWLNANKVDYVLIGPAALAIRGDQSAEGPVAIVLAPYSRNFDRLAAALVAQHAGLRSDRAIGGDSGAPVAIKLTGEKLARGRRWLLRFGRYDLDIEAADVADGACVGEGGSRFQELLYESNRYEPAPGVSVEVASPEDLEHYSHVRRTGVAPEFRVIRNIPAREDGDPDEPPQLDGDGEITAARVEHEDDSSDPSADAA